MLYSKRQISLLFILTLLTLISVGLLSQPVQAAAIYTVTNLNDSGAGSLRQAILDANGTAANDVIDFSVSGTITLTSGQLDIANNGSLTIDGGGVITVSGNNSSRVFNIAPGGNVTIQNLTIINGFSPIGEDGGGIYSEGPLTINSSVIMNNTADNRGGGVYADANVTVTDSILSGNSATTSSGGGLHVEINSTTIIRGSTFTGNMASLGGGINVRSGSTSTATIINSTISGNTAGTGGGVRLTGGAAINSYNSTITGNDASPGANLRIATTSIFNLNNTIVANPITGLDCVAGAMATVTAQNTLLEDGSCGVTGGVNGNLNGDPDLAALTGSPAYHPLNPGSVAIDAGDDALIPGGVTTDQAGQARIINGVVDMGAYEALAQTCSIAANQSYTFGDLEIFVQPGQLGSISCFQIAEFRTNHPDATPGIQTGVYWAIDALDGGGSDASGYTADLTITTPFVPDADDKLCRYTGIDWDCAADSFTATTITRQNVTQFSDWAVGNDVGPTAIAMNSTGASSIDFPFVFILLTIFLLVTLSAWLWRKRGGGYPDTFVNSD